MNNHKNNRKRKRWFLIGGGGVGLVVILLAVTGLSSNHQIDPSRLAETERGDIARSVVATGKIEPLSKVEVKSKASGIVKQVLVDYGDWVKQGQILAELDKEELRARVREARANHLAAQASQQASQAAYERNQVEAKGPDLPFQRARCSPVEDRCRAAALL